jgi:hypothetical protein
MPASLDSSAAAASIVASAAPAETTTAPAGGEATAAAAETVALAWRVHRLREEPKKVRLIAAGYAVAMALWWLVFPHPLALFLPVVALTSALAEFLFPINYRLTTRGAYADCGPTIRLFMDWKDVRRVTHGDEGIFLSPFARPSRLDGVRGIRLRYPSAPAADSQGDIIPAEVIRETVKRLWRDGSGGEEGAGTAGDTTN